jgi:hypothetical protein
MRWKVVLDEAAFQFFVSRTAVDRRNLLRIFEQLRENPQRQAAYKTNDSTGRPLTVWGKQALSDYLLAGFLRHRDSNRRHRARAILKESGFIAARGPNRNPGSSFPKRAILARSCQLARADYPVFMTSGEIIEEIKRLPDEERQKVLEFARANLDGGQLTGKEIAELTRKMVSSRDTAEAARLEEEIIRGFYGAEPHA